jgi:hypothetical protein
MKESLSLAKVLPGTILAVILLIIGGWYISGRSASPAPAILISSVDYKLFAGNYAHYYIGYANAGTVHSGPYAGYHLIVANADSGGVDAVTHVFATKDYKTFVVDTSTSTDPFNSAAELYAGGAEFNPATVVGADHISIDAPPLVIDEGNFALARNGGVNWEDTSNLASSTSLASNIPGLWFSTVPSSSRVSVETADKLVFDYTLISKEGIAYNDALIASSTLSQVYWDLNKVYYTSADLALPASIYESYGVLIPNHCGVGEAQVLPDVTQEDLMPIASTKRGVQLYTFRNQNNPWNKDEYDKKITFAVELNTDRHESRSSVDRIVGGATVPVPIPTFEQYVVQHPVLVFKDPWGRWVGIGEIDYPVLTGGCGKPVIYLYPPKATDVTVSFVNPIQFNIDIPTYQNGWRVRAYPDGTLKDLQPQVTDCTAIDATRLGSEYAARSCATGTYPYLYWAGAVKASYPTAPEGWIIARAEVADFLSKKLTLMGLNEKERTDMESYWVPQLMKKDVPYYRISFFQTATMSAFIPMKVTPSPDTVFRVFLDWTPLTSEPGVPLPPQHLTPLIRDGFTLVEWGGLEQ